jgi:SAM-dependent methyltransferase
VLDLGCGTGRHALWLAAAGARVTALDFSPGMLEEARRKPGAEGVSFRVHDLHEPLPFPAASFDRVVSGLVLEHLRELRGFFAEARRVLRPGGRAVVSAMHPAMFLRGAMARFTDPGTGEKVQPGSVAHSLGDFAVAASRAGFALEAIDERAPDDAFAARYPRAERYVGWPMLAVLRLSAGHLLPRIHHVAVWVSDLERSRAFYVDRLGGRSGPRYDNPRTGLSSYFVQLGDDTRIELMTGPEPLRRAPAGSAPGWAHVALSVGSRSAVDATVLALSQAGVTVERPPRTTGDGCYEAVILDPDGNPLEITE